jgi:NADPH:quinone reductase-like Zn-dependent oxidoreductase
MKAVYLEKPGERLKVIDQPEPKLCPGSAIVDISAAPVLSFMRKVVSEELPYAMATPWIPGANGVGVTESVAADVAGLKPGDPVFIDPHIYTHTRTDVCDGILLGLTALSPLSSSLQQRWRNGTFAQKCVVPAGCLTPLGSF